LKRSTNLVEADERLIEIALVEAGEALLDRLDGGVHGAERNRVHTREGAGSNPAAPMTRTPLSERAFFCTTAVVLGASALSSNAAVAGRTGCSRGPNSKG